MTKATDNAQSGQFLAQETDEEILEYVDAIESSIDAIRDFVIILTGKPHLIVEDARGIIEKSREDHCVGRIGKANRLTLDTENG